jgi:hypothetical protein
MDLIERYLQAVRGWLPATASSDDILRELREDIESQVDERNAGGSRDSGESGLVLLIKARGNPMSVARRYLPDESLVGPALYPQFRRVTRIVLGRVLAPFFALVALGAALFARHPLAAVLEVGFVALQAFAIAFGIIVIAFASFERHAYAEQVGGEWDPRRLPKLRIPGATPCWESLLVAAGSAVLVVAFVALAAGGGDLPVPDPARLAGRLPGSVWNEFIDKAWRIVVALMVVNAAAGIAMFARPEHSGVGTAVRAIADGILAVLLLGAVAPHVPQFATHAAALGAMGRGIVPLPPGALDALVLVALLAWGLLAMASALHGWRRYRRLGVFIARA